MQSPYAKENLSDRVPDYELRYLPAEPYENLKTIGPNLNPKLNPKPQPQTLNAEPQTPNPKHRTPNPKT